MRTNGDGGVFGDRFTLCGHPMFQFGHFTEIVWIMTNKGDSACSHIHFSIADIPAVTHTLVPLAFVLNERDGRLTD